MNSYQKLKQRADRLQAALDKSTAETIELVLRPSSDKSTEIKIIIELVNSFNEFVDNAIWNGEG